VDRIITDRQVDRAIARVNGPVIRLALKKRWLAIRYGVRKSAGAK